MYKLTDTEYHPYFKRYTNLVPEGHILDILEHQLVTVLKIFHSINDKKALYRYDKDKWSIKELLGHLIDTERVFSYRVLCFCRHDKTFLPGYDQDLYVQNANFDEQSLIDLLEQFEITRTGFIKLYKSLPPGKWNNTGNAEGKNMSVGSIAYIMAGHVFHHLKVLKDRYLTA
ncbi:DinB family protein [candidate division KSB1 bacterium]|nr:DinB family protein [candidate division KSB1 bacterium]